MPLSLLEAMSYGNCCLVSDIPECTEVVEDTAIIFKKSDVSDLKKKLQEACEQPETVKRLKEQAADYICRKYNWDDVVKETVKLYRRDGHYIHCLQVKYETTESYYIKLMKIYRGEKNVEQISS